MKISARNQLKGKIGIDIGGRNIITSTISVNAVNELQLEIGKTAYAIIKATSVMVGVE